MNIKDLEIGKSAKITKVGGEGALRQHFLDMGLIPGAQITMIKFAPMGDPVEIKIHGYELTLRLADAEKIEIDKPYTIKTDNNIDTRKKDISHPGLGEGGKFHTKADENPLPDGTKLTFALFWHSTMRSHSSQLIYHISSDIKPRENQPALQSNNINADYHLLAV